MTEPYKAGAVPAAEAPEAGGIALPAKRAANASAPERRASLAARIGSVDVFLLALKISLLLELFSTFFADTVAPGRLATLAAAAALLSALLYACSCGARIRPALPLVLLLVFYCYIFGREALLGLAGFNSWFYIFGAFIGVALLVSCCPAAGEVATFTEKVLICFSLVHAVATIAFWLVPSLYDNIVYPAFFSGKYVANSGYKSGLTTHYSTNGMYLALGMVSCTRFLFDKDRDRRPVLVAAAVLLFALLLTTKRAHLVFSLCAIVLAYIAQDGGTSLTRYARLGAAVLALVVAFLVASYFVPDLWDVVDRLMEATEDETLNGRTGFYEICFDLWKDNPLLGAGWGSFSDAYFLTSDSLPRKLLGYTHMDAHNVFIQVLGEEGLIGLALFVATFFSAIWRAFFGARRLAVSDEEGPSRSGDTGLLAWSVAIQAFFLMYCITGNPLYEKIEYVPYLLSLICLAPTVGTSARAVRVRRRGRSRVR